MNLHANSPEHSEPLSLRGDFLLILLIISVTFLIKFAIPFAGSQVFLSFVIITAIAGFGYVTNILKVNAPRLGLYLTCIAALMLTQLYSIHSFSLLSLVMIILVHFPYIFEIRKELSKPGFELIVFRKIMIILAVLGIAQYFLQFIIGAYWAFFLDHIMPPQFIMQNFFGLRQMTYESPYYKPTAFFLLEPSHLSQLLAIGFIIEMIFFRNLKIYGLFLLAIAMTFSGTGLIPLLIMVPFILLYQKKFFIFFAACLFVLSAPLWAYFVGLGTTIDRTDEIFNKGSSGYARFIGPYESIRDYQVPDGIPAVMFGQGAGTLNDVPEKDYEVATSTWNKIFYEYGVLGTIFYLLFFGYALYFSKKDQFLIATIMITYWLLGENLFPPTYHGLILALLIWPTSKSSYESLHPTQKN